MREQNRMEPLLAQVADMLEKIRKFKGSLVDTISPSVFAELERLETAVALFDETNRKTMQEAHVDIERLKMEALRSPLLTTKEKQIFQNSKKIERDARTMQLEFSKAIERAKKNGKKATSQTSPSSNSAELQKMKERRKRFKPLGGTKNWIPM